MLFDSPHGVPVVLVSVFALLFAAEYLHPLRPATRSLVHRVPVNLLFSALAFLVGVEIVRPVGLNLAALASGSGAGLTSWLHFSPTARFCIGFLLMDFTFYWWHRANHSLPLLWRFHAVHHVDPDLDVTTAFRFHLGEILYSAGFRAAQVGLLGVTPTIYLTYETFFTLETMFHHSNIRLPIRLERILNQVIVTPRMHGIHHFGVQNATNSNYSVIFRWWDALHRTLRLNVLHERIVIGIPGYRDPSDNRLWDLLSQPFCRQKNYWRLPDGTPAAREPEETGVPPTTLLE